MTKYKVVKARQSEIENPINLKKGDNVLIKEYSNPEGDWAGWVYCESKNNAGWIPHQIIRSKADLGFIEKDYDATEFDLSEEEVIIQSYELNGWVWGYKENEPHQYGWAPINHMEKL